MQFQLGKKLGIDRFFPFYAYLLKHIEVNDLVCRKITNLLNFTNKNRERERERESERERELERER